MGLEPLARRVLNRPGDTPAGMAADALAFITSTVSGCMDPDPAIAVAELGGLEGIAPLVPQLLSYGETKTAEQLISLMAEMVCNGRPALRTMSPPAEAELLTALLAGVGRVPHAREALLRRMVSVTTNLSCSEPKKCADNSSMLASARRCCRIAPTGYIDLLEHCISVLIHYVSRHLPHIGRARFTTIESLIDFGQTDLATALFDARISWRIARRELPEAAICAYRLGRWQQGDVAMRRVEQHRPRLDNLDTSFASRYLRANRYRVGAFFDRLAPELPLHVASDDGRAEVVLERIAPRAKVLEVGCGKARFLKAVRERRPDVSCTGIDLSRTLLADAPAAVRRAAGTLESIPCQSDTFDTVFSVEAIEHSSNWRGSVAELIRVTRPGGWVLIIDKPRSAWGTLPCPAWERWPAKDELVGLMRQGCDEVDSVDVAYDGRRADGLIAAWRGRKRSETMAA